MSKFGILIFVILLATCILGSRGELRKWRRDSIYLDLENKYALAWEVDLDAESIEFEVTVETTGFVGFGISPTGGMTGADIFIGGVDVELFGLIYYSDLHGVGNQAPVMDLRTDWRLHAASDNGTHTYLRFSRLLDTCDDQDYPITDDTSRIIWSFGSTDKLEYHNSNRGTTSLNLVAPPPPEFDPSLYQRWDLIVNTTMSSNDTSYFCTAHKTPNFTRINHIVAFEAALKNEEAVRHTHHFTLFECVFPEGVDGPELMEPLLYPGYEGHECYDFANPIPTAYCSRINHVWAVGGKMTVFPDNLGLPTTIGETYYMLEIHYDNPLMEAGKSFETGLTVYMTENLRETEVGIFINMHGPDASLIVPPSTSEFLISTQCSAECTTHSFPPEGIYIFNALLHSHLSGRKMKFRQFRDGIELPWIISDNAYDFNFQQNKPLRQHVHVLPGDELRTECLYDSNWKNGDIVTGGLSSSEEMCESIFYYFPRIPTVAYCMGSYPLEQVMLDIGVTNYTLEYPVPGPEYLVQIHSPPELAGEIRDVLRNKFNWTPEFIAEMREKRKFGIQINQCSDWRTGDFINTTAKYPVYDKDYVPEDKCLEKN